MAAALASLMTLTGCPGDDTGDDGNDDLGATTLPATDGGMDSTGSGAVPSHAADVQPIWDEHCVSVCHEPGGEWVLLDMSPGVAYDNLTTGMDTQGAGMRLITPGDTEQSYLWHKINGTQADAGGGGVNMPKARMDGSTTTLTQAQLDTIEAWIAGGAPE